MMINWKIICLHWTIGPLLRKLCSMKVFRSLKGSLVNRKRYISSLLAIRLANKTAFYVVKENTCEENYEEKQQSHENIVFAKSNSKWTKRKEKNRWANKSHGTAPLLLWKGKNEDILPFCLFKNVLISI